MDEDDDDPVENVVSIQIEVTLDSDNSTIEYGSRVEGDPRKRVNITLRASVHELMASMASERGCSRSRLLEELLLGASDPLDEQGRRAG